MRWASVISERAGLESAIDEATHRLVAALGGREPDLVLAFIGGHPPAALRQQARRVSLRLPQAVVLGCGAGGVIGGGDEVEGRPAVSLTGALLPGVELTPFSASPAELDPARLGPEAWQQRLGIGPEHQPAFLLLPDAATCDVDRLITSLDAAFPGSPKVGGLPSGARPPERNTLLVEDELAEAGVVGVAMVGDLALDTVVAQGARALGRPMTVTRAERHLLHELDGEPAVGVLDRFFAELPAEDRARFGRGPLIGIALDPTRKGPRPGDFLMRDLLGVDRARKVVGVGASLREGQIVQFHLRDPAAASEELHELLGRWRWEHPGEVPAAALLFSCLGRGAGFYGVPDHDSRVIRAVLGDVPVGGFFCAGEIGPVHTRTFLHGYTSSLALIRARGWD